MQDGRKVVWNIPYISVAFFSSLKQNFIAYRSSKVSPRPDSIFEIHQLHIFLQSVFIEFLKFISCDNQALLGFIPIPAVAVYLNLKS